MAELYRAGKKVNFDEDGFMTDPDLWDEQIGDAIAREFGIEQLSKHQRQIITFMRAYYAKFHYFPILQNVCKNVRQHGRCVQKQFDNPEIAWKIAGLPKFDGVHFVNLDGEHYIMEDYC